MNDSVNFDVNGLPRVNDMDVIAVSTSQWTEMPALLLMGLSIVVVLYLTFRKRHRRDPLSSLPFRSSLQQQKALERDMQNVVVELSEMTRQMSAQLETRAAKLDLLIQEADQKIARLDAAMDAVGAGPNASVEKRSSMPIDQPVHSNSLKTNTARAPAIKTPGLRLVKDDTEDRWADIYSFADQGMSTAQIAQKLNRPEGEIDLILHIRPKTRQPIDVEVSEPPIVSAG